MNESEAVHNATILAAHRLHDQATAESAAARREYDAVSSESADRRLAAMARLFAAERNQRVIDDQLRQITGH